MLTSERLRRELEEVEGKRSYAEKKANCSPSTSDSVHASRLEFHLSRIWCSLGNVVRMYEDFEAEEKR